MTFIHKIVWYFLTCIAIVIEFFIKLIWLPFAVIIGFFSVLFGLNYKNHPRLIKSFEYGTKLFDGMTYHFANVISDFYYPYK